MKGCEKMSISACKESSAFLFLNKPDFSNFSQDLFNILADNMAIFSF